MGVGECGPAPPPRGSDQNGHRHNSTIPCVHVKVETGKNLAHIPDAKPVGRLTECEQRITLHGQFGVKPHEKRNRSRSCSGSPFDASVIHRPGLERARLDHGVAVTDLHNVSRDDAGDGVAEFRLAFNLASTQSRNPDRSECDRIRT